MTPTTSTSPQKKSKHTANSAQEDSAPNLPYDTPHSISENAEWHYWCYRIDQYVEQRYANVMPPIQRDMVKRLAYGNEQIITARPYIYALCKRIAGEVRAIVAENRRSEIADTQNEDA